MAAPRLGHKVREGPQLGQSRSPGTLGVCAMGISETPPVCQAPAPGRQSQGLATPRHW